MKKLMDKTDRRAFLGMLGGGGTALAGLMVSAKSLGIRSANAKVPEKIVIGYLPVNAETVIYRNPVDYWKEAGLNVELFLARGGPAILQAMTSGSVPVGDIGNGPAVIVASRGLPFYYLTLGAFSSPQRTYTRVMVRGDSPIKKVEDLKGKKLAIHQRGTMEDLSLGAIAKSFDIRKDDIDITFVPFPHQPQALAKGLVDAIYTIPPFDAIMTHRFGGRTLAVTSDFVPYLGYGTLALRRDFAAEYPEAVTKLVRGWILTSRWIRDDTERARTTGNNFFKIPADVGPHVTVPHWAKNPLPVMPNIWHIYHLLLEGGIIKPMDDPKKVIDEYFVEPTRRFAEPVMQELGYLSDPLQKSMIQGNYPLLPQPNETYFAPWERTILGT